MKASRQDMPPSLPALLLARVQRGYDKEQPPLNRDSLGSLQLLPHLACMSPCKARQALGH